MKITRSLSLALAVCLATGTVAAEKIVWKPVKEAVLRIDDKPARQWNLYQAEKKEHLLLVELGVRYLMLDVKAREVWELEPGALARKGNELIWEKKEITAEAPRQNASGQAPAQSEEEKEKIAGATGTGMKLLTSEEWSIRDVGRADRYRLKLSAEGRVLDVQVAHPLSRRSAY